MEIIQYQGWPISCLNIPPESIKEKYLGCAAYEKVTRLEICEEQNFQLKSEYRNKGICFFVYVILLITRNLKVIFMKAANNPIISHLIER